MIGRNPQVVTSSDVTVSRSTNIGTRRRNRTQLIFVQFAILLGFLLSWEFLPKIMWMRDTFTFLDPYFISSPSETFQTLRQLAVGNGSVTMWSYASSTITASLIGIVLGTALGAGGGLLLSNNQQLSDVLRPFILAANAIPRIALIPVIVILFGPTLQASIFTAVTVVFFVVFFNAYEGGRSVSDDVLENSRLLGASRSQLMWQVRGPYVVAWTITSLPNAVSFGLVSVVTAEILTGTVGMGRLLLDSVTTVQSSLTFAVVVVLSVLGVVLVAVAEVLRTHLLHWWSDGK